MDIDVAQLRAAAAERRQGRRWQPVDERKAMAAALVEGRSIPAVHNSWSGPEFTPPVSLNEWVDDRLTERTWPSDPVTEVVFAIAEAMRESPDAAVTAVKRARRLAPPQQYLVFATLMGWRRRNFMLADPVLLAVIRQWEKLKLAEKRPDDE
jgi:hypothetical protein